LSPGALRRPKRLLAGEVLDDPFKIELPLLKGSAILRTMNKGHVEFKPYTSMNPQAIFELQVSAEQMYHALKVVLESEKLKSLLEVNDVMAYRQAKNAVQSYEDNLFHI